MSGAKVTNSQSQSTSHQPEQNLSRENFLGDRNSPLVDDFLSANGAPGPELALKLKLPKGVNPLDQVKDLKEGLEALRELRAGPMVSEIGLTPEATRLALEEHKSRAEALKKAGKDSSAFDASHQAISKELDESKTKALTFDNEKKLITELKELRGLTPEIEVKKPLLDKEGQGDLAGRVRAYIDGLVEGKILSAEETKHFNGEYDRLTSDLKLDKKQRAKGQIDGVKELDLLLLSKDVKEKLDAGMPKTPSDSTGAAVGEA